MPANTKSAAPTLFFTVGGRAGLLVSRRGRRRQSQPMPVADAYAALAWCLENGAAFVCLPAPARLDKN